MCSSPEQTFFQANDSHEAAMAMTEDGVSRRLSATNKTYFYFTTASLTVCLVFALATIMVLIVQRKGLAPPEDGITAPSIGNELKVVFTTLQNASFMKAAAYMTVSKPINSPKLKWTNSHILQDITYNSKGDPVIQTPGLYLVYCNLHFHLTNFSSNTIYLKMELLVNNITNRQTLLTPCSNTNRQTIFNPCASVTDNNRIYQELSIFHLVNLDADDWLSVKTEQYEYLDLDFLPNDNILTVLRYSDKSKECADCFV
ncbi:tumor necrosis factor ligand superfamily member 8 isoform X1 [Trachemys scripta elegans]|uniref:tumor necrosis factor ligand superfamily member 8 n=1 Tax=Malaclemys terrapin pileata TaxID=2991368 RepID=UPI001552289E|nr:tumor necrosis factor ligand superfamily member 8 isoform X1 [Trachemys scripta elegans]XP_053863787.1 tumor necrosis factor ligand superfamily member 8 [Malaclemys terrapin pileata]